MMNTKKKIAWKTDGDVFEAVFKAPNKNRYVIEVIRMHIENMDGYDLIDILEGYFKKGPTQKKLLDLLDNDDYYTVAFGNTSESDSYGITGSGNSFSVLSIVVNGLIQFFNSKLSSPVKFFYFNAYEENRRRLYAMIVKRIKGKIPFNFYSIDVKKEDGVVTYWLFYK